MTGNPYPEVTGASLPSSLTRDDPFALVYSTIPPVLVCGTVTGNSRSRWFSWKQKEPDLLPLREAFGVTLDSARGFAARPRRLVRRTSSQSDAPFLPFRHTAPRLERSFPGDISPKGDRGHSDSHAPPSIDFPSGAGILTCCPSATPFGLALGPTNPTPMTVAWETLGIRRAGFSPA